MNPKQLFDEVLEGLGKDEADALEKKARLESIKMLVGTVTDLVDSGRADDAKSWAENTTLVFTANAIFNGGLADWLPFVIDCILVSPNKEVQAIIRDAANVAMKGIIVEIDPDIKAKPLSDLNNHITKQLAEKMSGTTEEDVLNFFEEVKNK